MNFLKYVKMSFKSETVFLSILVGALTGLATTGVMAITGADQITQIVAFFLSGFLAFALTVLDCSALNLSADKKRARASVERIALAKIKETIPSIRAALAKVQKPVTQLVRVCESILTLFTLSWNPKEVQRKINLAISGLPLQPRVTITNLSPEGRYFTVKIDFFSQEVTVDYYWWGGDHPAGHLENIDIFRF